MMDSPAEKKTAGLPVIAIVGRPNVGKSSLFNAIVGRKLAIVHEMSGVTRDRISETVSREGRRFTLIDTGGLGTLAGEEKNVDRWDRGIALQVAAAVADADVLLFVTDAQAGLTPLDLDVAKRLRASGKTVLAVANKCDSDDFKNDAAEFVRLGFGTVFPVCCLRRGGVPALLTAALSRIPRSEMEHTAQIPPLLIAVVGRPNVGKSSLINALVGEERLMTSPIAGTTRDAVDVPFELPSPEGPRPAILVDTAGLRRKGKVDTVVELFSAMRAQSAVSRADLVLFVTEAGASGITAQDKKIADLIEHSGKGCIIAANKLDLVEKGEKKELLPALRRALPNLDYAPVVFLSAEKKLNFPELFRQISEVGRQLEQELPTGVLNRVLQDALDNTPPPVVGSAPLKVYYASMTGRKPPRILLFVNRPGLAAAEYLLFLKRKLAAAFGLTGIPLSLELRARPKRVESIRRNENAKRGRRAPARREKR